MKYQYEIIKEHKLIIEQVSGQVTIEELAEKTHKLFTDSDYNSSYNGVADFRQASSQITRTELYGFANFINQSNQFGHSKWALIANDPMLVALSQIFQQRLTKTESFAIFSGVASAAEFVNNPAVLDYLH